MNDERVVDVNEECEFLVRSKCLQVYKFELLYHLFVLCKRFRRLYFAVVDAGAVFTHSFTLDLEHFVPDVCDKVIWRLSLLDKALSSLI